MAEIRTATLEEDGVYIGEIHYEREGATFQLLVRNVIPGAQIALDDCTPTEALEAVRQTAVDEQKRIFRLLYQRLAAKYCLRDDREALILQLQQDTELAIPWDIVEGYTEGEPETDEILRLGYVTTTSEVSGQLANPDLSDGGLVRELSEALLGQRNEALGLICQQILEELEDDQTEDDEDEDDEEDDDPSERWKRGIAPEDVA